MGWVVFVCMVSSELRSQSSLSTGEEEWGKRRHALFFCILLVFFYTLTHIGICLYAINDKYITQESYHGAHSWMIESVRDFFSVVFVNDVREL